LLSTNRERQVMNEQVILVDQNDQAIGSEEKMQALAEGTLHRSFSVFVVNSKQEMLIQKQIKNKNHSGGLWTNACSGHPQPGENTNEAAHRRLQEEMGFDCPLYEAFTFTYKTTVDQTELCKHEFGHVFIGSYDLEAMPNLEEIETIRWVPIDQLFKDIQDHPALYAYWFKAAIEGVILYIKNSLSAALMQEKIKEKSQQFVQES
jgi:isopentenyl-diphosphate delta-isomerase